MKNQLIFGTLMAVALCTTSYSGTLTDATKTAQFCEKVGRSLGALALEHEQKPMYIDVATKAKEAKESIASLTKQRSEAVRKGDKAAVGLIDVELSIATAWIRNADKFFAAQRVTNEKYIAAVYGKSAIPLSRKIGAEVRSSSTELSEARDLGFAVCVDYMVAGK